MHHLDWDMPEIREYVTIYIGTNVLWQMCLLNCDTNLGISSIWALLGEDQVYIYLQSLRVRSQESEETNYGQFGEEV